MRSLIVALFLAWVSPAMAEPLRSLTDFVKPSPAFVSGRITFEKPHRVFRHDVIGRSLFSASIRAGEPIDVTLTESKITLSSEKGLRISVAGVPVDITRLTYDDRTGQVKATSAILGTRLESDWIEARAEEAVERKFGPKLRTAFRHLKTLRAQSSLEDTGRVLNAVVDSFKTERKPGAKPGSALPTFDGHLTLVFPVVRDEAIRIGKATARLEEGDRLATTVMIRVPSRRKLQIRGVVFTSNLGVRIGVVTLNAFSATEEGGFQLSAQNGIDGAITGTVFALGALSGSWSTESSDVVQSHVEGKVAAKVTDFASRNEQRLLKVGMTPALVRALKVQPRPEFD